MREQRATTGIRRATSPLQQGRRLRSGGNPAHVDSRPPRGGHRTDGPEESSWSPPGDLWRQVALLALEELNTPVSLGVAIRLRYGEFRQIAELGVTPIQYNCVWTFRRDYQAVNLLKKFSGLPGVTAAERAENALKKGRDAEQLCRETNQNFRQWFVNGVTPPPRVASSIETARRKVSRILGRFSTDKLSRYARWGPGATLGTKNPEVGAYYKYLAEPEFTAGCALFAPLIMEVSSTWAASVLHDQPASGLFSPLPRKVVGNRITTVPKTALTDRLIAVEPGWNSFIQLGIGKMIRRKLASVGVDLNSQEENRQMALRGSLTGEFATIDLSSASDCLATELVRELLPSDWFHALSSARCRLSFWPDSKSYEVNHKFSSMGNGATFELESLIFWALSWTVTTELGCRDPQVYGDDIIVESRAAERVQELLRYCGFKTNVAKTFSTGYFRESCGLDAFNGGDVTPFRIKRFDDLAAAYTVCNGLRSVGLSVAAACVERAIPMRLRSYGPKVSQKDVNGRWSDCFLVGPESSWVFSTKGADEQWFFRHFLFKKALVWQPDKNPVKDYYCALLYSWYSTSPDAGTNGQVPLRGRGRWRFSEIMLDAGSVDGGEGWGFPSPAH